MKTTFVYICRKMCVCVSLFPLPILCVSLFSRILVSFDICNPRTQWHYLLTLQTFHKRPEDYILAIWYIVENSKMEKRCTHRLYCAQNSTVDVRQSKHVRGIFTCTERSHIPAPSFSVQRSTAKLIVSRSPSFVSVMFCVPRGSRGACVSMSTCLNQVFNCSATGER